ncbi:MAG: zinc ribbon domain-containing protein [Polyangiales bacterium]
METTDRSEGRDELARYVPVIGAAVVVLVAIPVGITRGAPAVALWLAFSALASAVLMFWEALRVTLDPTAPGDEVEIDDEGVPAELDARKKAALQALRDIEFERSIGRLSEEDYKGLEKKYRDEARAAMRAIDEGMGEWLARADEMLDAIGTQSPRDGASKPAARADAKEKAPEAKADVRCPRCETANDSDAVFCKKCGTRGSPESADAN